MADKIQSVKILHGALDESPVRNGSIILRGVLDPESLTLLRTDDYQRTALPLTSKSRLMQALANNQPFPDIELGMRGQKYTTRDDVHFMQDPIYIIDGLQRVSAGLRYLSLHPQADIRIGCALYFDTDMAWELERFDVLNSARVKVSPNVLLRNRRDQSDMLSLLYTLSNEATNFPLYQRVSWDQRMLRTEMLTANILFKINATLHGHLLPGLLSGNMDDRISKGDLLVQKIGINTARHNVMAFYRLIDTCWGIKNIQYKDTAIQLKGLFLKVLAKLLSDHEDFWKLDDKQLAIPVDLVSKIGKFPIHDPSVANLSSSSGKAGHLLYSLFRDHIDSGKRTKHLTRRSNVDMSELDEAETQEPAV